MNPPLADPRSPEGRLVRVMGSALASDIDQIVDYAPPRRRMTTGSHAEFVGALVHEFRGALASLKGASELLSQRRTELDEAVLAELSGVIDRQASRVTWLVRLLEAVDGDGSSRRVEPVDGATVVRQAAAATEVALHVAAGAERDNDVFPGDPERVRLGLEMLFEAMCSPVALPAASMPSPGCVIVVAPALDLEEQQRRFALRSAFRVLDMEGCQLRVRTVGEATRAEVRLGPRRNK